MVAQFSLSVGHIPNSGGLFTVVIMYWFLFSHRWHEEYVVDTITAGSWKDYKGPENLNFMAQREKAKR